MLQRGGCYLPSIRLFGYSLSLTHTSHTLLCRPEALGIVPGSVFLVCLIFCLVGYAWDDQHHQVLEINSALLSVCFMLFLGFTDDVLDWPWRYKCAYSCMCACVSVVSCCCVEGVLMIALISVTPCIHRTPSCSSLVPVVLPTIASLPLLCCYNGSTTIVVPIPLRSWLWNSATNDATWLGHLAGWIVTVDSKAQGSLVDLGYLYLMYMGLLAVFCTNAINIFAGINGLEAGQSYVIACAILLHNLIEISNSSSADEQQQQQHASNHMLSLMTMLSFVGVTLGLLRHNWYPASVFVGDTYCYFAGMTFACVGILGHFSKTLLLFFIPQILNFLWSLPQLLHIVPCPRHRLPKFNPHTGKMEPSTYTSTTTGKEHPNRTLICVMLQVMGPMTERDLCLVLLVFQAACCALGFLCRYTIADLLF